MRREAYIPLRVNVGTSREHFPYTLTPPLPYAPSSGQGKSLHQSIAKSPVITTGL